MNYFNGVQFLKSFVEPQLRTLYVGNVETEDVYFIKTSNECILYYLSFIQSLKKAFVSSKSELRVIKRVKAYSI